LAVQASVIVPVHNGEPTLGACLAALLDQDSDGYEVIVVDDASTDLSGEIATSFAAAHACVRVLRLASNVGPAQARNDAIRSAAGPLLLLVDADCVVGRDWVRLHRAAQEHAGIVGGPVIGVHTTAFGRADGYCSWFGSIPGQPKGRRADHLPTANLSVARAVFERIGLFREGERLYSEDAEFSERARRAGQELWYDPSIAVRHRDRDALADYLRHQWIAGIQMLNYRREPGASYQRLMPRNAIAGWCLAAPLAAAYTAFIIKEWLPYDRGVLAYAPLIFAGKLAQTAAMALYSRVPSAATPAPPSLPPVAAVTGATRLA
jgi:glycosyltransferase involved in cell wall biosynthesis